MSGRRWHLQRQRRGPLQFNTVIGNTAHFRGANIRLDGGKVTMAANIFADPLGASNCSNNGGTFTSGGFNQFTTDTCLGTAPAGRPDTLQRRHRAGRARLQRRPDAELPARGHGHQPDPGHHPRERVRGVAGHGPAGPARAAAAQPGLGDARELVRSRARSNAERRSWPSAARRSIWRRRAARAAAAAILC